MARPLPPTLPFLAVVSFLVLLTLPVVAQRPGDLDTGFGDPGPSATERTGSTVVAFEGSDVFLLDTAAQPDGKIVAVGWGYRDKANNNQEFLLVARFDRRGRRDPDFGQNGMVDWSLFAGSMSVRGEAVAIDRMGRIVVAGALIRNAQPSSFAVVRFLPDGTPDRSFGWNGLAYILDPGSGFVDVEILADGSILAAGSAIGATGTADFAAVRFDGTGRRDPGFGSNGVVKLDLSGGRDAGNCMEIQPDGKILIAGRMESATEPGNDMALVRLLPDGTLDPAFEDGGVVRLDNGGNEEAKGMVIQADGKIVLAGLERSADDSGWLEDRFALVRVRDTGRIDTSFGRSRSGWVYTDVGQALAEFGLDLTLQFDGKIVLAGTTNLDGQPLDLGGDLDFTVFRYDSEGDLDPTFGDGGITVYDLAGEGTADEARAVSIQPDGRIVVVGPAVAGGSYWQDANYQTFDWSVGFVARLEAFEAPMSDLLALIYDTELAIDQGVLQGRLARNLLADLDKALDRLQRGDRSGALRDVESYRDDLDAAVAAGEVDAEVGSVLLDQAELIIAVLVAP